MGKGRGQGKVMTAHELRGIFKGRRVLVTGDTGFKGSWLALWMSELGAEVAGLALPPEREEDHFNAAGIERLIRHTTGDIRDYRVVDKVFTGFKPEFVFHLAARSLVRQSYEDPKLTFDTNVAGSVNILDAARLSQSLRSIVYVTSDKCYRNKEWVWGYRENDELGGRDPYSASKAAAEMVFSSYLESFFSKTEAAGAASVRAGNVIGGGDWAPERLVPDCVRALSAKRPVLLRNPGSTRPWQHVLDPLCGYILLAARLHNEPGRFSGSWNFGPDADSMKTVKTLAEMMVSNWGSGEIHLAPEADAPHEARLLHLNCDKAKTLLGWRPAIGFEKAVADTVQWYRETAFGASALDISRNQIRNYMEALK